jgi:hypothetical protein
LQYGDLSDSNVAITNVGEHWNPENNPHGCPNVTDRHVGDMVNLLPKILQPKFPPVQIKYLSYFHLVADMYVE